MKKLVILSFFAVILESAALQAAQPLNLTQSFDTVEREDYTRSAAQLTTVDLLNPRMNRKDKKKNLQIYRAIITPELKLDSISAKLEKEVRENLLRGLHHNKEVFPFGKQSVSFAIDLDAFFKGQATSSSSNAKLTQPASSADQKQRLEIVTKNPTQASNYAKVRKKKNKIRFAPY